MMTLLALTSSVYAIDKNTVEVTYDGDKAVVTIADNISGYVSASIDRAYVKLTQAETVTDNAHKNGVWVGICGELGADLSLTEAFLRMGIDELSVSATSVLPLRDKVRSLSLK